MAVILLIIVLAPASARMVRAVPQLPDAFYGKVTVAGNTVPDGTIVAAYIGNTQYANTTVRNGQYLLKVPADDPDTPQKEGGDNGDIVKLVVIGFAGGKYNVGSYVFESGNITNANLNVNDNIAPVVRIGPTPSVTYVNTTDINGTVIEDFLEEIKIFRNGTYIGDASFDRSTGEWNATINLLGGKNIITVKAIDMAGNTGSASVTITYQAKPSTTTVTKTVTETVTSTVTSTVTTTKTSTVPITETTTITATLPTTTTKTVTVTTTTPTTETSTYTTTKTQTKTNTLTTTVTTTTPVTTTKVMTVTKSLTKTTTETLTTTITTPTTIMKTFTTATTITTPVTITKTSEITPLWAEATIIGLSVAFAASLAGLVIVKRRHIS